MVSITRSRNKLHVGIQYKSKRCFRKLVKDVADARRAGDINVNKKSLPILEINRE